MCCVFNSGVLGMVESVLYGKFALVYWTGDNTIAPMKTFNIVYYACLNVIAWHFAVPGSCSRGVTTPPHAPAHDVLFTPLFSPSFTTLS